MRRMAFVLGLVLAAGMCPAPVAVSASARVSPVQVQALPGDFNGDLRPDLAIGVRGEAVGGRVDAGAVNVLYGGTQGPGGWSGVGSQLFTQSGAGGSAEPADGFGTVVAVGNFNGDGFGDLAVGAPGETVGAVRDAGAVNVLYGSPVGLTGVGAQQFTQDSP
ncbi:MAG: FG-GAP repeat protein, partial [Pseudonocardiaceae bacterium]